MKPFILIGEFDPFRLETWCRAAEAEGFGHVSTRDGDEMLRLLEDRGAPALLVTGLSLPRADGFEVLRALRSKFGPEEVPALAASVFRRLELAALASQDSLGLADVLGPRLDLEDAVASIRRAVSRTSPLLHPEDVSRRAANDRKKETTRLRRIERLGIGEAMPHDPMFQRLVEETARSMQVPVCLLSVVLQDRTQFLAHTGLERLLAADPRASLEWPFCRLVAEAGRELVVPDACGNPAFSGNRIVRDGQIRGYAGAPVIAPGGEVVGTLAVASTDRLGVRAADVDALGALARRIAGEMEIRGVTARAEEDADQFGSALGAEDGPSTLMSTLAMARTALDGLDAGVVLMDSQRRVVYANAAACEMLDAPPSRLLGLTREELVSHGCSLVENADEFLRHVRVTASGPYVGRAELVLRRPERRVIRWVSRPVQLPSGTGQFTLLSDITAETDLAEVRRLFPYSDALTGLPNRRAGTDALAREIGRAVRTDQPLCLALLDIDGLRIVNRDHGIAAGDRVLSRTAGVLKEAARECDTVIRWSGEEFLMLLPSCRAAEGLAVAERATRALEALDLAEAPGLSLSAGVVEWRPGESGEAVTDRAEEQLRKAKASGGARVA